MIKKKIIYPLNLCKMETKQKLKLHKIGTGARDILKHIDIYKPKSQFRISLNKHQSRGVLRLRRGVLRLRTWGPLGVLRLRIYPYCV